MAQYSHPNCMHPQPHCPFCDCDDCYRVAQQEVRRGGSGNNDQNSAAASLPAAPVNPAAASPPPQSTQWSTWLSSPTSRYVVIAGVTALTVGFWIASHHRRSHHFVLHHRMSPSVVSPLVTPAPPLVPPAPSSLPAGMGQYEAGFLKGSEVTAAMYRAMQASATDAWRSQWSNRSGWCRHRSW